MSKLETHQHAWGSIKAIRGKGYTLALNSARIDLIEHRSGNKGDFVNDDNTWWQFTVDQKAGTVTFISGQRRATVTLKQLGIVL